MSYSIKMNENKAIGYKWHNVIFHKSNELCHRETNYYDNFYIKVVSSLFIGTFYFFLTL